MEVPFLLCLTFLSLLVATGEALSKPILINCGSAASILAGGRKWVGDQGADAASNLTLSSPGFNTSTEAVDGGLALGSLYRTARIFNVSSNYTFSVPAGNYYIRIHFYSFPVEGFNMNESVFDVTSNGLRLLSKFNATEEIARKQLESNSSDVSMVKEYFFNISTNKLHIQFAPVSESFAFVSAIEVLPVLDKSFFEFAIKVGGEEHDPSPLDLLDRGMETMYRVNMGDRTVNPNQDPDLWRTWESDAKYMFSISAASITTNSSNISYGNLSHSLVAPLPVYEDARVMNDNVVTDKKFNMSWKFRIHPNFEYLVRLHFCELSFNSPNQRVFRIYINLKTAFQNYDLFQYAGGKDRAHHEDFLDNVPEEVDTLLLQLGQDAVASISTSDAILNGLEIFKLSKNGNLAHVSQKIGMGAGVFQGIGSKRKTIWIEICAGIVFILTLSVICVSIFYIRKKKATRVISNSPSWHPLILHGSLASTANAHSMKLPCAVAANRTGRRFSITEIRTATDNFNELLVIGSGGFGQVYKGQLQSGELVAVKRASTHSQQGLAEFETEIEMLSKLRHRHLVSLIGYCEEQGEMILVYEYMANGTLRSHLYGGDFPTLSWKQRLEACIGAARGLHYLHTGLEGGIIHRDIKTTNILLDGNLVAKMADFGLSKIGPMLDHTHVSTAVKGSFGYLDPEYFRRQQLTQKSDIYSFGVVLFEVVCARPVINPTLPKDQINLAEWAAQWQQQGSLEAIVDPQLRGGYSLESLKKFGEIALKCLSDQGKDRPAMGEVLWHLEYVLQLQESYIRSFVTGPSPSSEKYAGTSLGLPMIMEGEENACPEVEDNKMHETETKCEGQCSKVSNTPDDSSVG